MTQPSIFSLSYLDAASNIDLLARHYDTHEKRTEYVFGAWAWGHRFIRIDINEKIFYRTIYWIFSKIRLFQTEENNPNHFKALKEASEEKFKRLAAPYVEALTSANETLKTEVSRLDALRAAAVADIHALKKAAAKTLTANIEEQETTGQNQEIDALKEKINTLQIFYTKTINAHVNYKNELEKKEKEKAKLQNELDELLQTVMPLKQDNEILKEQLIELNKEIDQLKNDNELYAAAAGRRLRHVAHPHILPNSNPPHLPLEIEEPPVTLKLGKKTDKT